MAVYAILTDDENEQRFTLLAETTLSAADLAAKGEWTRLEVKVAIPEGSPLSGQFFQINITSAPPADQPDPSASLPGQVIVDNVMAERK